MNYKQLSAIHVRYAKEGLNILAFPCNQFNSQEPGTNEEIKAFAAKYDAQFQLFTKIRVNGAGAAPFYRWLKSKKSGVLGSFIKWNFSKFLVDVDGNVIARYAPNCAPNDIVPDIEKALAAVTVKPEAEKPAEASS